MFRVRALRKEEEIPMPKQRITREMVVDAAFSIAREQGMEQVLVKHIAARLGCSVQPIYSYCRNMEDLRNAVMQRACEAVRKEVAAYIDSTTCLDSAAPTHSTMSPDSAAPINSATGPDANTNPVTPTDSAAHIVPAGRFRNTGRAWLHVAKHEPQLFRLFLACRRQNVASWDALYRTEVDLSAAGSAAEGLGLDADEAQRLHLQMLVYTVGLGTIFAMTEIPPEEIFARQEDAYEAFSRQAVLRHTQKDG